MAKTPPKKKIPKKSAKNKGGRPPKFENDYIRMAYVAVSESGMTDQQLAKLFSVSRATISNWKKDVPKFLDTLKQAKDIWDCLTAENSMLKRVLGYEYAEVTREPNKNGNMAITKKVTKQVAPDVKACDIWLCNRNPNRWRKLKHVELAGEGGGALIVQVVKFGEAEKR